MQPSALQALEGRPQHLPEAVCGLDRDLRVTFANAATLRREASAMLGRALGDALTAQQALAAEQPLDTVPFTSQAQVWFRAVVAPRVDGLFVYLEGFQRDQAQGPCLVGPAPSKHVRAGAGRDRIS